MSGTIIAKSKIIQHHSPLHHRLTTPNFNHNRSLKPLARQGLIESNVVTSSKISPGHHA